MISYQVLKKANADDHPDYGLVEGIASQVYDYLGLSEVQDEIRSKHVVGARSSEIQGVLLTRAVELGFRSERGGLFAGYRTSGLRPDYFRPVGTSGILMEVERGKTLPNNMDLLDLWKCHICAEADYLFLIVPQVRQTESGRTNAMFERVVARLSTFFVPENYVNVKAVFVFGY